MNPTPKQKFSISLYSEHLEEASFLYEQRLSFPGNPELTWLDPASFENRFEAHIDALVTGGDLAIDVSGKQAVEGDFGELHAATCVFCRQNRFDLVTELLERLDHEDEERVRAVTDALKYELPRTWHGEIFKMLSKTPPPDNEKLIPIAAEITGWNRLDAEFQLMNLLHEDKTNPYPQLLRAMGRMKDQYDLKADINHLLPTLLNHDDENIRSESALTLLRIGNANVLEQCLQLASSQSWTTIPIGLGGNRTHAAHMLKMASEETASPDCLKALGLLGDISAIPLLLKHLETEELAESATIALNLITGAELYEEFFIPDPIYEDELFDDELEKLKKGEPVYPPGEEPGEEIERLSQNPDQWQTWWVENKSDFKPQIRHRNGKPYSPACLVENLKSEKSLNFVRKMAYEELVIRYDIDFPFETDMFVQRQKEAIAQYERWIEENPGKFEEGKWYFAGKSI